MGEMGTLRRFVVPAMKGAGVEVLQGQRLRVIDLEGGQVADLVAFRARPREASPGETLEFLSTAATIDLNGSVSVRKGTVLYTNLYNEMLFLEEDTVGSHDLLHPACSPAMYRIQYGIEGFHPSCETNLLDALERFGVRPGRLPVPFNIFMNTEVGPGGRVTVRAPRSRSGDRVVLEARMDIVAAVSACSVGESACNSYKCGPIGVEILG